MSLKSKSVSAVLWSAADIFARQGLGFAFTLGMARLLTPEEFGTIALLYVFIGIAGVFVDSGFSAALIQKQSTTSEDESTVFWFNAVTGAVMALGLYISAPYIAKFYGDPALILITEVLAFNVFIGSLGSIHSTLLTKKLNFKIQMRIGLFATMLSGIIGVTLAWRGYSIWAIVAQILVANIVTTLLLWSWSTWRPRMVFSYSSAKGLFSVGGYLMLAGLLDAIYSRAYTILIGKIYGVRELGLYSRADNLQQTMSMLITEVIARVSFPIFSSVNSDLAKLRGALRIAIKATMLVNAPAMLGVMALAEPLILTLLGEKWAEVVPILQVLCLAAVLLPLHVMNLNILKALGHTNIFFKIELVKKIIGTVLIIFGAAFGVMGVAWSMVFFSVLALAINAYYTEVFLSYGLVKQIRDILPVLCLAVAMVISIMLVDKHVVCSPAAKLIVLSFIGAAVYVAGIFVFHLSAFYDVYGVFKGAKQIADK